MIGPPKYALILASRTASERQPADAGEFQRGARLFREHHQLPTDSVMIYENAVADYTEAELATMRTNEREGQASRRQMTQLQRDLRRLQVQRRQGGVANPAEEARLQTEIAGLQADMDRRGRENQGITGPWSTQMRSGDFMRQTRENVLRAIQHAGREGRVKLDTLVYFGHGLLDALNTAGFYHPRHTPALANAIRQVAEPGIRIVLYACSAGSIGGFASHLHAALADINPQLDGHTSVGHAFQNPDVTRCGGGLSANGEWLIPRGDPLWRAWYQRMQSTQDSMWCNFPFMTREQIRASLTAVNP